MVVLGAALVLVFGIAKVLGNGSDGADDQAVDDARASQAAADASPEADSGSDDPTPSADPTPSQPTLPEPTGPCDAADLTVTPVVKKPVAGRTVKIVLNVQSMEAEACTWSVSSETLTMKITSGSDDIWSSQECPASIKPREVVVRKVLPGKTKVWWNARRSDEECTNRTAWALPGYYIVQAAALGGEPLDTQFRLTAPVADTVTQSPDPQGGKQTKGPRPGNGQAGDQTGNQAGQQGGNQGGNQGGQQGGRPSGSPSGAVEPNG